MTNSVAALSSAPSSPRSPQAPQGVRAPASFFCPITREIMTDPVVAADEFTYDRFAIEDWFAQGHRTSPMTNEPLGHTHLIPNGTLRNEIRGGRELVGLDSGDILELATALTPQTPAPALATAGPPQPPMPAGPASLSVPPRYEDFVALIPNRQQSVLELSNALAPQGFSYKDATGNGNFGTVSFSRRLTAAEAHGTARYEYLTTVIQNTAGGLVALGDEMRTLGWSYQGYSLDHGMLTVTFRRRLSGPEPRARDMVVAKSLMRNTLENAAANALKMRARGWSFVRFDVLQSSMLIMEYKRPFARPGESGAMMYENRSHICENKIDVVEREAQRFLDQGWSFDRWDVGLSIVLHFKRPIGADGTVQFQAVYGTLPNASPAPIAPAPAFAPTPAPAEPRAGRTGWRKHFLPFGAGKRR